MAAGEQFSGTEFAIGPERYQAVIFARDGADAARMSAIAENIEGFDAKPVLAGVEIPENDRALGAELVIRAFSTCAREMAESSVLRSPDFDDGTPLCLDPD